MRLLHSMHWRVALVLAICAAGTLAAAGEPNSLWQIGKSDKDTADLALGPKDYAKFSEDPVFIVGASEAKREWPYVHPGPHDAWAGGREHAFTVLFGLKQKPAGDCRLLVDFADTHGRTPPRLEIRVNGGKAISFQTLPGGTDESVFGNPKAGRPSQLALDIPAAQLVAGSNEISIETRAGSWVLYDSLRFEAPQGTELAPVSDSTLVSSVRSPAGLVEKDGKLLQTVEMTVRHVGDPVEGELVVKPSGTQDPAGGTAKVQLKQGTQTVSAPVAAVSAETPVTVELKVGDKSLAKRQVVLQPVRKWIIYLLPHSHVDIGYTHVQTEVEQSHWKFYEQAIEASRRTANYPVGAQFKWNVEVLWATDSYLKQASPEKQQEFLDAVKKGWIGLQALYGNELTALCRPEELVRLVDYAGKIGQRSGVPVDTAMISDVPGYTWGLMSVFAGSGVKYMSIGPNGGDRIGWTLAAWADKPFYWTTPDGKDKILCWIPERGYWRAFDTGNAGQQVFEMLRRMEAKNYPYDVIQVRYCLGDNAGPGVDLSELVKDWNTKYAYPKLVIATASEMMRDFERRYADKIPEVRGDFTPYWEDGAASSALETALNRAAAERLSQAEAIWAMTNPKTYPTDEFYAAWRNVILYDEHTWGAHCSISQPDSPFTKSQWAIKQAFALDADRQSRTLLEKAAAPAKAGAATAVMVYNTNSWARTDLVTVPASLPRTDLVAVPEQVAAAGTIVKGPDGKQVRAQRLSTGELVFLASDVPAFGAKRFTIEAGGPASVGDAKAEGAKLSTAGAALTVDEKSGGIASLTRQGIAAELVDAKAGLGLNDYFYVLGSDSKNPKRNGPVSIKVKERGPLVASLLIEGDAPGCRKLAREVRVIDGLDRVDLINTVDKAPVRAKEGVHFGFAFNVPKGVVRMDIPWAVVRPEEDQMPGACKNWFTVQRWVDVSNEQYGVTWATVDAPLVEVGGLTADRIGGLGNPKEWLDRLEPSQTLYSWAMNNHWHTNYKADQEGPTVFRYALRPHAGAYCGVQAARFGIEQSQPLVAVPAATDAPATITSRLNIESDDAIVASLKPSNDGKAVIVRLFGASGKTGKAALAWSEPAPKTVCVSDLTEKPTQATVDGAVEVPAHGIVTLRAELE